jgi:FMN reductase
MDNRMTRIAVIIGSVRSGNYTSKAVALAEDELSHMADVGCERIDPADLVLPLPGIHQESPGLDEMRRKVSSANGVIFATPEYHGSYSSVTKLIIDNLSFPSALSGKPIALLGVAAGSIGAIKALEHLRSVCSHVGGIVLPGPVSVANVRTVFDEAGACLDSAIEGRIRALPNRLIEYLRGSICPGECLEEIVRGNKA